MKLNTNIEFEGTLAELAEFMEATFKNHDKIVFTAKLNNIVKPAKVESLLDDIIKVVAPSGFTTEAAESSCRRALRESLPTIVGFVESNAKINAIKELRAATNCGLREAKDAVEEVVARYVGNA